MQPTKDASEPRGFERERPPFTLLEDAILDDGRIKKSYTKMVYWVICRHANRRGEAWPSLKLIAEQAGVSVSSVQLALAELEELEYIKKVHRYRKGTRESISNLYAIPSQYEYRQKVYRHTVDLYRDTVDGIPSHGKELKAENQKHEPKEGKGRESSDGISNAEESPSIHPSVRSFLEEINRILPSGWAKINETQKIREILQHLTEIEALDEDYIRYVVKRESQTSHLIQALGNDTNLVAWREDRKRRERAKRPPPTCPQCGGELAAKLCFNWDCPSHAEESSPEEAAAFADKLAELKAKLASN